MGTQSADVPPSSPPIASLAIIRYLPHLVPIPKRLHTTYTPLQIRTATPHQTPGHHLRPATARPAWNGEPSLHRMAIVTSLARQRLLSRSTVLYWWWLTLGMARPPPSALWHLYTSFIHVQDQGATVARMLLWNTHYRDHHTSLIETRSTSEATTSELTHITYATI